MMVTGAASGLLFSVCDDSLITFLEGAMAPPGRNGLVAWCDGGTVVMAGSDALERL